MYGHGSVPLNRRHRNSNGPGENWLLINRKSQRWRIRNKRSSWQLIAKRGKSLQPKPYWHFQKLNLQRFVEPR